VSANGSFGSKPDPLVSARISAFASCGHAHRIGFGRLVPESAMSTRSKAAAYSITSSARASTELGRSRPSNLAVFRLITSSYLVGACTGRSAGFSPLRMRSTQPAARRYGSIELGPVPN
jgi:hypothetical protein